MPSKIDVNALDFGQNQRQEVNREIIIDQPNAFAPRKHFRETLILRYLKERLYTGRVMDAGCGDGDLVLRLARAGYNAIGVELSNRLVQHARDKASRSIFAKQIEIKQADLLDFRISELLLDGIVCGQVLEHIDDDFTVFRNFNQLLKPEGICIITVPFDPQKWNIEDNLAGHIRRYSYERVKELFERNGFTLDKVRYWGFPFLSLYYKCLYLRMLKSKSKAAEGFSRLGTKLSSRRSLCGLAKVISTVFSVDMLFGRLPLGIGIIARGIKKTEV